MRNQVSTANNLGSHGYSNYFYNPNHLNADDDGFVYTGEGCNSDADADADIGMLGIKISHPI